MKRARISIGVVVALVAAIVLPSISQATNGLDSTVDFSGAIRYGADGQVPGERLTGGIFSEPDEGTHFVEDIGFSVEFDGDSFSSVCVSVNGAVELVHTADDCSSDAYNSPISQNSFNDPIIAPLNLDLVGYTHQPINDSDSRTLDDTLVSLGYLTDVVDGAVGGDHACALTEDTSVFCWGLGEEGQLGNGYFGVDNDGEGTYLRDRDSWVPVQVVAGEGPSDDGGFLTGVTAISAGSSHTCALVVSGAVFCWGLNSDGQLGDDTNDRKLVPTQVLAGDGPGDVDGFLTGVTAISAGYDHTCALDDSGAALCWGFNASGRLGDGTSLDRSIPTQVVAGDGPGDVDGFLTDVRSVEAGYAHTCAVTTDGELFCWGENGSGRLGDNTTIGKLVPTAVLAGDGPDAVGYLTDVRSVEAGYGHTCAVTTDGELFCWGENGSGQLGDGTSLDRSIPTQVVAGDGPGDVEGFLIDVRSVEAGFRQTCAVTTVDKLFCWGDSPEGQLGTGWTQEQESEPVQVLAGQGPGEKDGLTNVEKVFLSGPGDNSDSLYTCAIVEKGFYCWGVANYGGLGNNKDLQVDFPVRVAAGQGPGSSGTVGNFRTVVSGGRNGDNSLSYTDSGHSCALDFSWAVYCWGYNELGQLGNGGKYWSPTPSQVLAGDGPGDDEGFLTDVTAISAGSDHTCALDELVAVFCWGENGSGQLGDNTNDGKLVPTQVVAGDGPSDGGYLTDVRSVEAGADHTCALDELGAVFCWGNNDDGQLGDGTNAGKTVPTQVLAGDGPDDVEGFLTGVTAISAGGYHTCAVTTADEVFCWGYNDDGQLGDDTTVGKLVPTQVSDLTGVTAISAGGYHTCAVTTLDEVFCWGLNSSGQLGDGSTASDTVPRQVVAPGGRGELTSVQQVSGGMWHTCAVSDLRQVFCWGYGSNGELGNNGYWDDSDRPSRVLAGSASQNSSVGYVDGDSLIMAVDAQYDANDCVAFDGTGTVLDQGGSFAIEGLAAGNIVVDLGSYGENSDGGLNEDITHGFMRYSNCVGVPGAIYVSTDEKVDGRDALIVTWYRMSTYANYDDALDELSNTFQLVIIDFGDDDATEGNFAIEFNYGLVNDARDSYQVGGLNYWPIGWAGYDSQENQIVNSFELFQLEADDLVDDRDGNEPPQVSSLVNNSLNSPVEGRYAVLFRDGGADPSVNSLAAEDMGNSPNISDWFLPNKPVIVAVQTTASTATVSWSKGLAGITATTGYTVSYGSSGTCQTATTSCVITDLQPDTAYTFVVAANTLNGDSEDSEGYDATTLEVDLTTTTTVPVTTTVPATVVPSDVVVNALPVASTPLSADTKFVVGGEVTVTYGGFVPFELVQLIVASTPQLIGSGYADAQGFVTVTGLIPQGLSAGNHSLVVYAPGSGIGFRQSIVVSPLELPATGSGSTSLMFAFMVMLAGVVITAMRRRLLTR